MSVVRVKKSVTSPAQVINPSEICEFVASWPNAVEWIDNSAPHKAYFDFEKKTDSSVVSREQFDDECLKACTRVSAVLSSVLGESPLIITTSSHWDYKKISFHFIFACPVTGSANKAAAIQANETLVSSGYQLDLAVYGSNQAFRMLGCHKHDDPLKRKKVIYQPATHCVWRQSDAHLACCIQVVDIATPRSYVGSFTSKNPLFVDVWDQLDLEEMKVAIGPKASKYEDWIAFMYFVVAEVQHGHADRESATALAVKFTQCGNKFAVDACLLMLDYLFDRASKREQRFGGKIRKWFPKKAKALENRAVFLTGDLKFSYVDPSDSNPTFCAPVPYDSADFVIMTLLDQGKWFSSFFAAVLSQAPQRLVSWMMALPMEELRDVRIVESSKEQYMLDSGRQDHPFACEEEVIQKVHLFGLVKKFVGSGVDTPSSFVYPADMSSSGAALQDFKGQLVNYHIWCGGQSELAEQNSEMGAFLDELLKYPSKRVGFANRVGKSDPVSILQRAVARYPGRYCTEFPYRIYVSELKELRKALPDEQAFHLIVSRTINKATLADMYFGCLGCCVDDRSVAFMVLASYPFWFKDDGGNVYVFDDRTGMWTQSVDSKAHIIGRYSNQCYSRTFLRGSEKDGLGLAKYKLEKVVEMIASELSSKADVVMSMARKARRRLLFPNGYYDGEDMKFVPSIGEPEWCESWSHGDIFLTYDVFFACGVKDPFIHPSREQLPISDARVYDDIVATIFHNMHGEAIGEFHRESIATALMGEPRKAFHVLVGDPNSGKSTEIAMLRAACASTVGTANSNELRLIKNDSRDAAMQYSMVYHHWHQRILLFSEASTGAVSVEMMKSLASGKLDEITCRTQYKAPVNVIPNFEMFFYQNKDMEADRPNEPAYLARKLFLSYDKVFRAVVTDPLTELKQRPEVETWRDSVVHRQLFVRVLLDSWEAYVVRGFVRLDAPLAVTSAATDDVAAGVADFMEPFFANYVVTGNESDFVDYQEVNHHLAGESLKFLRRFHAQLSARGHTKNVIVGATKRIKNERKRVWLGVRARGQGPVHFALRTLDETVAFLVNGGGKVSPEMQLKLVAHWVSTYGGGFRDARVEAFDATVIGMPMKEDGYSFSAKEMEEFDAFYHSLVSNLRKRPREVPAEPIPDADLEDLLTYIDS